MSRAYINPPSRRRITPVELAETAVQFAGQSETIDALIAQHVARNFTTPEQQIDWLTAAVAALKVASQPQPQP